MYFVLNWTNWWNDCGPDSGSGGGIEGEFEMSQVRGVRRGQRPDRPRSNGCVGTLDSRDR